MLEDFERLMLDSERLMLEDFGSIIPEDYMPSWFTQCDLEVKGNVLKHKAFLDLYYGLRSRAECFTNWRLGELYCNAARQADNDRFRATLRQNHAELEALSDVPLSEVPF